MAYLLDKAERAGKLTSAVLAVREARGNLELAARILSVVRERSTVRRGALVLPTARDVLDVGEFDFAAEWVGEVPAASTETAVAPLKKVAVAVMKARAKAKISRDLLDDQPALLAWLVEAGGDALGLVEDRAFVAGDGNGKPLGFAVDTSVGTTAIEGTTANTISNTGADLGSATDLQTLEAALPDAYAARSRWFMTGSSHGKIRGLLGPGGNGWAFPEVLHPQTGEPTLLSRPVSRSSAMPDDGADGRRVVALCDIGSYVVAARQLLAVRVDSETFGDVDQVLFSLIDRVGSVLGVPAACRVGVV
jgi:HK97 family phage major capsid protein